MRIVVAVDHAGYPLKHSVGERLRNENLNEKSSMAKDRRGGAIGQVAG